MFIICTNVGIIVAHIKNNVPFWLLLGHSMIAVGAFLAPILANVFKIHTLTVASIAAGIFCFGYFKLLTPEDSGFNSRPLSTHEEPNAEYPYLGEKPRFIQYQIFGLILIATGM